ncbi:unnamed protein product, partial [Prorocentrum cordatum]
EPPETMENMGNIFTCVYSFVCPGAPSTPARGPSWPEGRLGLQVAGRLVRDGEAQLGDLRPFVGFSGWAALQLELELQRGVWVRARAPDRPQPWRRLLGQPGGPCWRACLRASGMRALSLVPRGGEAGDASLRRRVEAHSLAQVQEMVDAHAQASA